MFFYMFFYRMGMVGKYIYTPPTDTHIRYKLCHQDFDAFVHEVNNFISTVTVTTIVKYQLKCLHINLGLVQTREFVGMESDSFLNKLFNKHI